MKNNEISNIISNKDTFTFVVMSDLQWNWEGFGTESWVPDYDQQRLETIAVVDSINSGLGDTLFADFVLMCGDIVQDRYADSQYVQTINVLNELNCEWFNTPGNHDIHEDYTMKYMGYPYKSDSILTRWNGVFTNENYSWYFYNDNWAIMSMASSDYPRVGVLSSDINFCLENTRDKYKVAITHYSPVEDDLTNMTDSLYNDGKAQLVFNGHKTSFYDFVVPDGNGDAIYYYTVLQVHVASYRIMWVTCYPDGSYDLIEKRGPDKTIFTY